MDGTYVGDDGDLHFTPKGYDLDRKQFIVRDLLPLAVIEWIKRRVIGSGHELPTAS